MEYIFQTRKLAYLTSAYIHTVQILDHNVLCTYVYTVYVQAMQNHTVIKIAYLLDLKR